MIQYIIEGGNTLEGKLSVYGAKNSALVLLSASLLAEGVTVIERCPDINDVKVMLEILRRLGCKVVRNNDSVSIDTTTLNTHIIPQDLSASLRGSVFLLGALCGRLGRATLGQSGGCAIGARPIDIHLAGLRAMGVETIEEHCALHCVSNGLVGTEITLRFPSVGATENLIMSAVLAKGKTILHNCAVEPEVVALQEMLIQMGADIQGVGRNKVIIHGVKKLNAVHFVNIPDRIVTATYITAVCACGGCIEVNNCQPQHLIALFDVLDKGGADIFTSDDSVKVSCDKLYSLGKIVTAPYPAFATDMQSLILSCCAVAHGRSTVEERIFENRLQHNVQQLCAMGANITLKNNKAIVRGKELHASQLTAMDLRGGAGLLIAGLCAKGRSILRGVEYIDRGYIELEKALSSVGAKCMREVIE